MDIKASAFSQIRLATMKAIPFTLAAVVLYIASDRALNYVELRRGARFEHRSFISFMVLVVLALVSFSLIQRLAGI
jgi:hypothetical protein